MVVCVRECVVYVCVSRNVALNNSCDRIQFVLLLLSITNDHIMCQHYRCRERNPDFRGPLSRLSLRMSRFFAYFAFFGQCRLYRFALFSVLLYEMYSCVNTGAELALVNSTPCYFCSG